MTTINFNLVHAFCRTLEPGDEIVVTALDHDANVSPWLLCAQDHGLVVRTADVRDGDLQVEPAALEAVVGPRTKVVRVHARLERGRHDARGSRARRHRALRRRARLGGLRALRAAPPHRREGAGRRRAAVLARTSSSARTRASASRARSCSRAWPADRVRPAGEPPAGHRFETGTMSHEALAGVQAAIDFIASLGEGADRRAQLDAAFRDIVAYETALTARMLDGLGRGARA